MESGQNTHQVSRETAQQDKKWNPQEKQKQERPK